MRTWNIKGIQNNEYEKIDILYFLGAYLIFKILGAAIIRGWRLLEGGAYFEILKILLLKCFYNS